MNEAPHGMAVRSFLLGCGERMIRSVKALVERVLAERLHSGDRVY